MEINPDNLLYVVDNLSEQVLVLDLNGNLIHSFGEDVLIFPTGIAYDQYNDRILVAEHGGIGSGFFRNTVVAAGLPCRSSLPD